MPLHCLGSSSGISHVQGLQCNVVFQIASACPLSSYQFLPNIEVCINHQKYPLTLEA